MKSLDAKLARIRGGGWTPADFIIADAKDGEMAYGLTAAGPLHGKTARFAPRAAHLEAMREMTLSGLVDILLTSASSCEELVAEGLFTDTDVTPAVRLNDATDVWSPRGGTYRSERSRPFRTARLDRVRAFADLGLYSVTFSNDVGRDLATLEAYAEFRLEAATLGMRHFLEVFDPDPALGIGIERSTLGAYINDCIVRALAGVVSADRPLFLKIAYNGARALEEIAGWDPSGLVVGVLGGARGTARDTFELIAQAYRHGARIALFGRKIALAESPVELVRLMRAVIEHDVTPIEAVKIYHDRLEFAHLRPDRSLSDDLEVTDPMLMPEATP